MRGAMVNAVAILTGSGNRLVAGGESLAGAGGGGTAQDGPWVAGVVTGA